MIKYIIEILYLNLKQQKPTKNEPMYQTLGCIVSKNFLKNLIKIKK